MPITSVEKQWSETRYSRGDSGETATEVYSVVTDTPDELLDLSSLSGLIPQPRTGSAPASTWPGRPWLYVQRHDVTQRAPTEHLVTVVYGTFQGGGGGGGGDPLSEPWTKRWTSVNYSERIDVDPLGNPILNSAGDTFIDNLERDMSDVMLTIVRNRASFDPLDKLRYENTLNADPIYEFPAMLGRIVSIDAELISPPNTNDFWRQTITVQFRRTIVDGTEYGWTKRVLDQGLRELVGGVKKHITDGEIPVITPVLLNGSGQQIASGGPAVFIPYNVYPVADWSPLDLEF